MYSRIKQTADALINGRAGINPSVNNFLRTHGDEPITQFVISRNVISSATTGAINLLSPSFARKTRDTPLYHLKVLIRTVKTSLSLEKTSVITISQYKVNRGDQEMPVPIPRGTTLNALLDRTLHLMGRQKFIGYSASGNNCQHFILDLLRANGLQNERNVEFVKQATDELFTPSLRKIANTTTQLASAVDTVIQGGDVKKINPWIAHVKIFASQNRVPFFTALKDERCKSSYQKKSSRQ